MFENNLLLEELRKNLYFDWCNHLIAMRICILSKKEKFELDAV